MSMTQEEIEELMNDTSSFSQDDEISNDSLESIDDILAGIDGVIDDEEEIQNDEDDIDDILANIDGVIDDAPTEENNNIDNIIDDLSISNESTATKEDDKSINSQIDNGVYPLPVSNEHQVVNQLNEVAEDSEEKASQIFDVLSFILDENDRVNKKTLEIQKFLDDQLQLLETLNNKFPNISIFTQNIEQAKGIKSSTSEITDIIEIENNKIFEAMELMQYHDINRQKIERVMAVIRKLANYLSGIFSDDVTKPEVQIAKHISGDGQDIVNDDDLDSLIAEFNK